MVQPQGRLASRMEAWLQPFTRSQTGNPQRRTHCYGISEMLFTIFHLDSSEIEITGCFLHPAFRDFAFARLQGRSGGGRIPAVQP